MATSELILAMLRRGAVHGYDLKRTHDSWFPDARPLAFGQVYATLSRLERAGLVRVAGTRPGSGPERTIYALTDAGEARLAAWLGEPAEATDELVRKAVAALRTSSDPAGFLARQRAAHLRRMRRLSDESAVADPAAQLARDHVMAHLDADLRWLDLAVQRVAAERS